MLSLLATAPLAPATAATYPNGTFKYSPPTAAALPATPPSGTYTPSSMDDVGIQAAINAAANAGGGTVTLASGTYVINNSVVPKTEVWINGMGRGVSILQRGPSFVYPSGSTDTSNWTGLIYTNITGSVGGVTDLDYSNFTIDGNFTTAQLGSIMPNFYGFGLHNDGVGPDYSYRIHEDNLEIKGCTHGNQMTGTQEITLSGGYYHDNGGGTNNIYWHNIYFRRCGDITVTNIKSTNAPGGDCFKFAGGTTYTSIQSHNLTISGSTFDNAGYNCGLLNGVSDARVYNNTFTRAGQLMSSPASNSAGVWLATEPDQNKVTVGCSNVDLVNNVIQSCWANGVEIDSSLTNNVNISGNLCNTNGTNYNIASGGTNVSCDYNTVGSQAAAPSFSPGTGTYASTQSVTISTTTGGASIRYTTDGSTPSSTAGTLYTGPVTINASRTLKAIAYETGYGDSPVTSGSYTIGTGTITARAGSGWQNQSMTSEAGTFTATFDATPSASPDNAVVTLSLGAQTAYTGFACLVRFNTSGDIDARDGGAYAAANVVPFSAGSTYHFRLTVDVGTHNYSIYVTPPGKSEITIGSNYAFRTEQNTVTSLNNWRAFVDSSGGSGTLQVANFNAY